MSLIPSLSLSNSSLSSFREFVFSASIWLKLSLCTSSSFNSSCSFFNSSLSLEMFSRVFSFSLLSFFNSFWRISISLFRLSISDEYLTIACCIDFSLSSLMLSILSANSLALLFNSISLWFKLSNSLDIMSFSWFIRSISSSSFLCLFLIAK